MTKAEKRAAVGGFLWIVAVVQYFVAQVAVASQWRTPYSWWDNYISDLGNTACGRFMGNYVCSPLAGAMNASFIIAGLLTVAGVGLMGSVWPPTSMASLGVLLWILAGAGQVLVGAAPENEDLPLHLIGALNLPVGSVAILLLGLASRRTGLGLFGIVLAVVGLVGTTLSIFAPDLVGVGGAERLAGYPGDLWLLVVGAAALLPRPEPASAEVLTKMA
ncbi:DUF998 domain-containing protein [Kutzneria sp. CA-103260]|uniref:DUF998 domain-containing protein n=1 Tax=Kutzneria sp. CA-103260 TaxID=2802641 RepID=UPI001BAE45A0|nr:DUF998 domain-containing protein [Kutzneria sp. CA-103260]QUQ66535.1 hypothetical protein JJ691_42630 [Kutzneria sp. CA-103260]